MPEESKRLSLSAVILVGLTLSLASTLYFISDKPIQLEPALIGNAALLTKQEKTGRPVRLKVPKIDLDTTLEQVGLTPGGAMDVPTGPFDAAWFELGPRPGEVGSAVIAGHYGQWKNGERSVFDNLNQLKPGDNLLVEDEKGITTTFVVREIRTYNPNEDAFDVFSSNDGKAHLNLITCAGVWNETSKSYPQRLVVFTDLLVAF